MWGLVTGVYEGDRLLSRNAIDGGLEQQAFGSHSSGAGHLRAECHHGQGLLGARFPMSSHGAGTEGWEGKGRERKGGHSALFIPILGFHPMTSSKRNYLPKAPSPNTITLEISTTSTSEVWGDTDICSTARDTSRMQEAPVQAEMRGYGLLSAEGVLGTILGMGQQRSQLPFQPVGVSGSFLGLCSSQEVALCAH